MVKSQGYGDLVRPIHVKRLEGIFFKLGTNVHLGQTMNCLNFGGQRSLWPCVQFGTNIHLDARMNCDPTSHVFVHNSIIHSVIMTKLDTNVWQDKIMKWWNFVSKRSKVSVTVTSSGTWVCRCSALQWSQWVVVTAEQLLQLRDVFVRSAPPEWIMLLYLLFFLFICTHAEEFLLAETTFTHRLKTERRFIILNVHRSFGGCM